MIRRRKLIKLNKPLLIIMFALLVCGMPKIAAAQETVNSRIGIGIGKVIKVKDTVFNIFAEPQVTVLHSGVGQPAFQLFMGLNMQFLSPK